MCVQIILNRSGDARHVFDPARADDLARAQERFSRLVTRGYSAFDRQSGRRLTQFDPAATETVFVPLLCGG